MYKRFSIIIALCVFVGLVAVILGIYIINNNTWEDYSTDYVHKKQLQMEYFFENLVDDMMNGVISHANWTETIEAVERQDELWLAENATTYIVDSNLFSIDYILVGNEELSFIQESGISLNTPIEELDIVKSSINEDLENIEFTELNGHYALIITTPLKDNNNENPTGVYVAIAIIDEVDINKIKKLLGENEVININFSKDKIEEDFIVMENYRVISTSIPILASDDNLKVDFQLDSIYKVFVIQRRHIIGIIIISFILLCIIILFFIKVTTNLINDINIKVKAIASGNYDVYLEEKGHKLFKEIYDLSSSVNKMSRDIKDQLETIDNNYLEMTDVIVNAVEINDGYTSEHNKAVGEYAKIIAEEINYEHSSDIIMAAKLHDMGKISIPGHILNKPGKLTDEEYSIIKTHPTEGYKIIEHIEYFSDVKMGVKYHHERWDGKGYPEGLSGNDIPLIAQIISVADVYDALTSDRAYRKAMTHKQAMDFIVANSGTMFNPILVKAFCDRIKDIEETLLHRNNISDSHKDVI